MEVVNYSPDDVSLRVGYLKNGVAVHPVNRCGGVVEIKDFSADDDALPQARRGIAYGNGKLEAVRDAAL